MYLHINAINDKINQQVRMVAVIITLYLFQPQ